ncbi:ral guanine nucleotide dissociation stimulator-like isoform X2 [Ailuropoda melanoleuca]|uniref:ral guanine nucleotide dissociation stimulator-like isoform X2 n=1 Tax=Ailuropoda melanoleuca TaxID=9646 RepID=UPI0014946A7D|nr:ral guanine nucleotide dissociation stimulator-like isoform X2 [Ailuropoda melanoleuca]
MVSRNFSLALREQPANRFANLGMALRGAQKRVQKKGVVPFLGTFLTELVMLDTAMEDYLEGCEINHQKKNKVAAENYTLEPEDPFRAWIQAMEPLSEAESYTLSCQLEPQS